MLFDPDDGLTFEQSFQRHWDRDFEPALKAAILQRAEAMGCTPLEAALHALASFAERCKDPIERQRFLLSTAHRQFPVGRDPRVHPGD